MIGETMRRGSLCINVCGTCGRTAVLHVSQTTYSRYENGTLDIPSASLIALARFYGTSVDYLLGLTDEPAPYRK